MGYFCINLCFCKMYHNISIRCTYIFIACKKFIHVLFGAYNKDNLKHSVVEICSVIWSLQWCWNFIILHQDIDCVNWFDFHKECKYFFFVKDNNVLKKSVISYFECLFIILFSFSSVELMKHPKFWSYIYAKKD